MNPLTEIGAIFSVIGIPSIFALVIYIHTKHIEIIEEQIQLLKSEKEYLEKSTSEKLTELLERRKRAYETFLNEQKEEMDEQKVEYAKRVEELSAQIKTLERDNEIWTIMGKPRAW